jgi:hypothetical protein
VLAVGRLGVALTVGILPLAAAAPAQAGQITAPSAAAPSAAASSTPLFAYYYAWFSPSSWKRDKTDTPLIGAYSSSDSSVMRHQIQQAKAAGIGGFIVSWKDTPLDDLRLRLLIKVAAQEHFKLAMIYQGLNFYRKPLPVSEVAADFVTFRDQFAGSPVFFRVDGKPLTIWSGTWAYTYPQVARVTSAVRPGMLVLSTEKNVAGFDRLARITDGDAYYWSSVNPATDSGYASKLDQMSQAIHHDGKYWIAPFAPGFDARLVGGHQTVSRDSGQTLRTEYVAAARSTPNMLGLISWNEFSENSYVEPSVRYGYQSLDVLRQLRTGAVPPSISPAPVGAPPAGSRSTLTLWANVLRLTGFALALIVAVGFLGYARRRQSRRRSG